jgi:heme-degrading monooxygenase HmoA
MTHVPVQVTDFERVTKEHEDTFSAVAVEGKAAGAIHHSFLEDNDGTLIILDEWPSEEAFQTFFSGQKEIPELMAAAGMGGPPSTKAFRILDTPDRF